MLDEAAQAGFGGLELGPYGYMPLDVGRVGDALDARGLRIVAGTIFDDLVNPGEPGEPAAPDRRDLRAYHRSAAARRHRASAIQRPT